MTDIVLELLKGIASGVLLSLFFSFGPGFFSLLQTSIHYGYRRASPFAFGVSAGDVIIVFLMLTVLRNVDMFGVLHNVYVASIASIVIAAMGFYTMFHRVQHPYVSEQGELVTPPPEARRYVFLRGFLLNIVNPLIWIYWVSVIALLLGETEHTTSDIYIFFAGMLGATLSLDLLKCKTASLLHRVTTVRVMNIFNKVFGAVLLVFALYIFFSMVQFSTDPEVQQRKQVIHQTEMLRNIHI